jgi:hypothetical protein
VYGLRTNSNAVGPTEHTEDGSCAEKRKREAPGGDASLFCRQVQKQACTCFFMQRQLQILVQTLLSIVNVCG